MSELRNTTFTFCLSQNAWQQTAALKVNSQTVKHFLIQGGKERETALENKPNNYIFNYSAADAKWTFILAFGKKGRQLGVGACLQITLINIRPQSFCWTRNIFSEEHKQRCLALVCKGQENFTLLIRRGNNNVMWQPGDNFINTQSISNSHLQEKLSINK